MASSLQKQKLKDYYPRLVQFDTGSSKLQDGLGNIINLTGSGMTSYFSQSSGYNGIERNSDVQITGSLIVSASGPTASLFIGDNDLFVSGGQVAIGMTTPTTTLQVNGIISGSFISGSNILLLENTASADRPRIVLLEGTASREVSTSSNHESRIDTLETAIPSFWTSSTDLDEIHRVSDVTITGSLTVTSTITGSIITSSNIYNLEETSSRNQSTSSTHETRLDNIELSGSTGLGFWTGSAGNTTRESDVEITGSLLLSGSVRFGSLNTELHEFTGSVEISDTEVAVAQLRLNSATGSMEIGQGIVSGFTNFWAIDVDTGSIGFSPGGGASIVLDIQNGTTVARQTFQMLDDILFRLGNGNDYQMKYDNSDDRFELLNAAENVLQTVKTMGTKADFSFGAGDLFISASGNVTMSSDVAIAGNLGIGLDNPSNKLHISGALGDFMRIDLGGSNQESRISGRAGSNSITSVDFGNTSAACLALNARGCINYAIDTDNNEAAQRFRWFKDAEGSSGKELMELNELGSLMVGASATSSHQFTGSLGVTGSVIFGSLNTELHEFTGSVGISGSLTVATDTTSSFGFIEKQGGSFVIDHPQNSKKQIVHCFVESDNAGTNIYRFKIEAKNKLTKIQLDLPEYFWLINTDPHVQITPIDQFAQSYYKIENETISVVCQKPGKYAVQVSGVRCDKNARNYWKGDIRDK